MEPGRVGKAIKTLRLRAGYTQHALADCLNVTDKAVSKWERGLSVPDTSIVTKLSLLLNCDVDNLLEGNIAYLENAWQGLLILGKQKEIRYGNSVLGKPLVYFFISYFLLAGVGEIYISCDEEAQKEVYNLVGEGTAFGIHVHYLGVEDMTDIPRKNTMVVYNNPFIYGPNLTKYFQRAMSRLNGVSVLTLPQTVGGTEVVASKGNYRVNHAASKGIKLMGLPVLFFPETYFNQLEKVGDVLQIDPLFAEPMGNGMIEYSIVDEDSLWDTYFFLRFLRHRMGKDVYDLSEVALNRNFLSV